MDMGAEFGYYTADLTRTIPVSGKFTPRQRALYDLVLGAQQAAMDSVRPGTTIGRLTQLARQHMDQRSGDLCGGQSCSRYFIHGLSHWVGMDVHDVGSYTTPLAAGMAFTIEPGIYIPGEGVGIRIEDVVLVTATGYENLSRALARTAEEVERAMRGGVGDNDRE
jgi:Xaa-Pro aminopeptidase